MPELRNSCRGKLLIRMEGAEVCRALTSDMEMQSLCSWVSFLFGQVFLTMLPFLPFGMIMYILCPCILEVCDLLSHFDFIGDYS